MTLVMMCCAGPVSADEITLGLSYLSSSQDPQTRTWGDPNGSMFRDTTVVIETFQLFAQGGSEYNLGVAAAAGLNARNNDDRARLIGTLSPAGQATATLRDTLLAAQNPEIFNPAQRDYPGFGWGIAPGFGNSTLDTALALRALQAEGLPGVLSVVNEDFAAAGTTPTRPFNMPPGATHLLLRVRNVTGGTLLYKLQQPNSAVWSVQIAEGGTPAIIAFPAMSGGWNFWAENLSGTPVTHTADVAFTDADGFNHYRITSALIYLGLAQNPDGGWGLAPGEDSHVMVTSEVVRALAGAGSAFAPGEILAAAASWLSGLQNPDGGFSTDPDSSNINETSMAVVGIALANPGANLETAADYLRGLQQPNGSWDNDAYLTAIALQALKGTGQDLEPFIFGDGFEPDPD
jgi:hypothetical protein